MHRSLPETSTRNLLRQLQDHFGTPPTWGCLRTELKEPGRFDQQERTQRCRAFLFVAAGIAAAIAKGARRVLMFESGTGAVNAPLMAGMAVGARTTKSSHPLMLGMMSDLASLMAQRRISVELPHWNRTKGELVQTLADRDLQMAALQSVSCAHRPRRSGYRQCGVCAACITRRQALAVAGIREPQGEYVFDIFSRDRSKSPPIAKQEDLKAVLNQVLDFGAIGPSLILTPRLKQWLLGTGIIARDQDAKPWLAVLWRYHCEWLRLAQAHRDAALPWAERLLERDNERYAHASGF